MNAHTQVVERRVARVRLMLSDERSPRPRSLLPVLTPDVIRRAADQAWRRGAGTAAEWSSRLSRAREAVPAP